MGCNFPSYLNNFAFDTSIRKRRIYTEEKAKVVAAAWGTELLQFLVARSFLNLDNLKIRNGNENILIFLVFISPIFT